MKDIKVSTDAYEAIDGLRNRFDKELAKELIADSMSSLSALIHLGRDEETIGTWTDDLLKVMFTLGEYNKLVDALSEKSNRKQGFFSYVDGSST